MNKKRIKLFWTHSPLKAVIIERFIRTIFGAIARYLTHNKTRKFVHKLQFFEQNYNNTYHRSIKMAPIQVNKANEQNVYKALYPLQTIKYKKPKFAIGDNVLVARHKKRFEKGYTANFFEEVYVIVKVNFTVPFTYKLQDLKGVDILGSFYEEQLQKVNH